MATFAWDAALKPQSISVELRGFARSGGRSLSGIEQTVFSDAGRWEVSFGAVPVHRHDQVRAWRAAVARLRAGDVVVLKVSNLSNGRDAYGAAASVTLGANAALRATQLTLHSAALRLGIGQDFSIGDRLYGLSPIEAAACSLDVHNAAGAWHKALLDNAARPSGALVYDGPEGGTLTEAQFERLKQELEDGFQGARNAGRPLLLEGGLDWKPLSLSPAELDFVAAKGVAAREIALAFGVPPLLLGLPGDNTHANFAEANRAFWRQTLIPLVRRTAQSLAQWLGPAFGDQRPRHRLLDPGEIGLPRGSRPARSPEPWKDCPSAFGPPPALFSDPEAPFAEKPQNLRRFQRRGARGLGGKDHQL